MNSLFWQVSRSPLADAWRRFRLPPENLQRMVATARALGMYVREQPPFEAKIFAMTSPDRSQVIVCFAEPCHLFPSIFPQPLNSFVFAFTNVPEAAREFGQLSGFDLLDPKLQAQTMSSAVDPPLMLILQSEERTAWLEIETTVHRSLQSLSRLEVEGEQFFVELSRTVTDLLSPDRVEILLEAPEDFCPEQPQDWTWVGSPAGDDTAPAMLTARLQRLLYRREQVLFVEDVASTTDIQFAASAAPVRSGFLLPLLYGAKPIGILKIWYRQALLPLPGEVEALELFRRELSFLLDRHRTYLRMQRLATVDGLTNLFNHRFFREQLRTEFHRGARYQKKMSLLMIDIDGFKSYNDTYGHLAGDRVLARTASTIRSAVRDIDFVARYGGEEFAVILPEVDARSGLIVAEKICKAVAAQKFFSEDGEPLGEISVSCGVTDNTGASSPEELIARADRALYWVKRHGRNMVRLASPEDDE